MICCCTETSESQEVVPAFEPLNDERVRSGFAYNPDNKEDPPLELKAPEPIRVPDKGEATAAHTATVREPGSEFTIDIEKPEGGLCLDLMRADTFVPSLIMNQPSAGPLVGKVEIYDRIVAVNGITGRVDDIAKAIAEATSLRITIRKPKSYTAEVEKADGEKLGLQFVSGNDPSGENNPDAEFFVIQSIVDGHIIAKINEAHTDRAIRVYDCLMDVNGIKGCQNMVEEITNSKKLVLTFLRHYKATEL